MRAPALLVCSVDVDPFDKSPGLSSDWIAAMSRKMVRAWTVGLSSFVRSSAHVTASSDKHTPINTGVMLLKPSLNVFERGLRVIQRRVFDTRQGFDLIGTPQEALRHLVASGALWSNINRTQMLARNDWKFIGGHGDQGLFVYLFLVLSNASRPFFAYPKGKLERKQKNLGTMKVYHFSAGAKPWRGPSRCPAYFQFMEHNNESLASGINAAVDDIGAAFCWRLFRMKRRCLAHRPAPDPPTCTWCRKKKLANFCGRKQHSSCDGTTVLVF